MSYYAVVGAEDVVFMTSVCSASGRRFRLPLVTAAAAGTVSRLLPVARSLYALRRCAAQGAGGGGDQTKGGGGGGQEEGAAGGEKKASPIDRCDASAGCACCYCCVELGPVAVTAVALVS